VASPQGLCQIADMEHVRDLRSLNLDGCELTIGSFDGVHRGHQALVASMTAAANETGLPLVILTFYPHPSVVLRERQPAFYITLPEERASLLGELGTSIVITQRFNKALSRVKADAYLKMLKEHLGFRGLWIGENFALGHRREGNPVFLEEAGKRMDFKLHVVSPLLIDGEIVSSTRVREALRSGDVARAASYLGRSFVLPGVVVKGSDRGKSLGFPTANLSIWKERACPGPGVYACIAQIEDKQWPAVTNIGVRPTFDNDHQRTRVETHLLDYDGDLYGQVLHLTFIDRLRDEQRFPDPAALIRQIERDVRLARRRLSNAIIEKQHG
jgi:riboflavin kinase/FMN adenylyltransferase